MVAKQTTLYSYALSPFAAKVHAFLNYKKIDFNVHYANPLKVKKQLDFADTHTIPLVKIDGQWKLDSTPIGLWLDDKFPGHPRLVPEDPGEREQVLALDKWVTEKLIAGSFRPEYMFIDYMELIMKREFTVDENEYPFESHWFEDGGTAMHYIDEGEGVPVVMLHGNPTWSFLYRHVVKELSDHCRAIAIDYPGFGFSEHPPAYGYTAKEHVEKVSRLLDYLELDSFILVAQDWGGPIGMRVATSRPEQIRGLTICNTWCWKPTALMFVFSKIMGGFIGKHFILKKNLFADTLLSQAMFSDKSKQQHVLDAYTAPFPTPASRMGTYIFPGDITKSTPWIIETEKRLERLRDKPVELVFAMNDPIFGKQEIIDRWRSYFTNSEYECLDDAGHFLQEDRPDRIAAAVDRIIEKTSV